MNSIRKKLFIYIGSLAVTLVGLTILANSLLLEPYYIYNQKKWLIEVYDIIDQISNDEYEEHSLDFMLIQNDQRVDIIIRDADNALIYEANANPPNHLGNTPYPKLPNLEKRFGSYQLPSSYDVYLEEPIDENTTFLGFNDTTINVKHLALVGSLENGYNIELKIPRTIIDTNIALYNKFALIIGGIIFVIAMFIAYLISNNFTKPIIQMNKTTKKIKNLDFNSKCNVKSKDEIGQLAQSINELSSELSYNIQNLNDKNKELKIEIDEKNRLDERRKDLLNSVSHELKTPLALMQGYAEGLKLNVSKSKEQSDFYCDVIMDEANKMNQLVEKLLNMNQVEFGDTTLHFSKFEINDFIESILKKYIKIFEENQIRWSLNKSTPTIVTADSIMLESVFTNYINNAINYLDNNKEISVTINTTNTMAKVEVFNTAPPFDDPDLTNIWNSFYKVDKSRTRAKGGHGLGLSIVKVMQEAHGNNYGVKNQDNGVCFWFDVKTV